MLKAIRVDKLCVASLASTIGSSSRWQRLLIPSFSDCFFVAVLIWLFAASAGGWSSLLLDGDAGWHIRTGEYILAHGQIPTHDIFSFSRPDAPWFAWEWLSDVIYASLFRAAGLKGVVLLAGILIALFSTIILRFALWRGANPMVAVPLTLLAVGSSTIHFLARPHLFTLLLLPLALWLVEMDRRSPGRRLWLLIPLTSVWTNLHGGFVLFLALLALLVAGLAVESWMRQPRRSQILRYSILLAGCSLATLVNPFGLGLHRHILEYLHADWIRNMVQEFQAPTFRSEGQIQFELLLILGLLVSAILLVQRRAVEPLWIIFLAHSSLTSVRHAPLYAAIASPILAAELTALWRQTISLKRNNSFSQILYQVGKDLEPMFRRTTTWGALAFCIILIATPPSAWPINFPKEIFPVEMIHRHSERLSAGRTFTTDQWADYLIFSFYPQQRVFVDGRSDFYGEAMGREYLELLQGGFSTEKILKRYSFDTLLIPVSSPLSQVLKGRAGWSVLEDDGRAILFAARGSSREETQPKPNEKAQYSRRL